MPGRRIPDEVKLAAIKLWQGGYMELSDILNVVDFSRATFYRTLDLFEHTGEVSKPPSIRRGRPRTLHREDTDYLITLIRYSPGIFLDEMQHLLAENRFIAVHISLIHRELQRLNVSTKLMRKWATERNPLVRADFILRVCAEYKPDQLMFTDESSKDDRTTSRRFGRSHRGKRAEIDGVFVRGVRYSLLPVLTLDGIITTRVVQGSVTREVFVEFLETQVFPLSSPFPGERSMLVLDNARIHHGEDVAELAERFGVQIEYLPPYSPDLNPIEQAFSKIKSHIRRHGCPSSYDLLCAADIITPSDAEGYFRHSRYL